MNLKKNKYDAVFITNIPAFYKVNLFNELNKVINIYVIFISEKSNIRESDFYGYNIDFEHCFLNSKSYENRSKIKTFFYLIKKILVIDYKLIVYSGWETREVTILSLLSKRKKNAIVIESSIMETKTTGLAWFLKKLVINRMSKAYPSGILQKKILDEAGFKGDSIVTHGVGITNYQKKQNNNKKIYCDKQHFKFIYIGRLSQEKNIEMLIDVFSVLPYELTIIGDGDLKSMLENKATKNIKFEGYVENRNIISFLENHNCFILPSVSEPWGLVVEEALIAGLPIIVSNKVGCHCDLIDNTNGLIFDAKNSDSLKQAIENMVDNYTRFNYGASMYDGTLMAKRQINSYLSSIK